MKPLIYVLEDDADIALVISRTLKNEGFTIEAFSRRGSFLNRLKRQTPDLCLVDLSLPDGDGLSVVTEYLRVSNIPSIVVTGRSSLTDKIIGLEVGADDYVVKPFEPRELLARVRAVLRRSRQFEPDGGAKAQKTARFAGWEANFQSCTLRDRAGMESDLSASETRLLEIFVKSTGRVLSRSQLMDHIRTSDEDPLDRSVDARISRLRKKLGDDSKSPTLIRTVYGAGYIFSSKVEWV
ncbi:response regulator transcription factor [Nitratireductor sp. XY-223]|uniref:response regulator transcription factor n=1 Tax=Nitratireductor sp. XY-223 TaxID=2561926 RepID=UPI0010AAF343|nr:response regulator transcription factor [Nitratireductor sp. XY-223]